MSFSFYMQKNQLVISVYLCYNGDILIAVSARRNIKHKGDFYYGTEGL